MVLKIINGQTDQSLLEPGASRGCPMVQGLADLFVQTLPSTLGFFLLGDLGSTLSSMEQSLFFLQSAPEVVLYAQLSPSFGSSPHFWLLSVETKRASWRLCSRTESCYAKKEFRTHYIFRASLSPLNGQQANQTRRRAPFDGVYGVRVGWFVRLNPSVTFGFLFDGLEFDSSTERLFAFCIVSFIS
jgi:hypothetical protein